jgi:hypothetical protein
MALNDLELARVKKIVGAFIERRRPPAHLRSKLDLGFRVSGQSVVIFEIRPVWRGRPGEKHEHGAAKATYVKSTNHWKVFWLRRDLKMARVRACPVCESHRRFRSARGCGRQRMFFRVTLDLTIGSSDRGVASSVG